MLAHKRVLVAEDNDMNFALVEIVLRNLGVDVLRAATGQEALDLATKEHPDLVYMDVQMPILDGLEVTRRLRAQPETQAVPVVALTALAMAGDEEKVLAAGCNAYISKPVSPATLREMTRRFLDDGQKTGDLRA